MHAEDSPQAASPGVACLEIDSLRELSSYLGVDIGPGGWQVVDQELIDRFGHLTGDTNWYHVDSSRAAQELPGGRTIAHGMLTLSLLPGMAMQLIQVRSQVRALNYGLDKVRFPAPVPVRSRLRLKMRVESATPSRGGVMFVRACTLELEGSAKPALIASMSTLVY